MECRSTSRQRSSLKFDYDKSGSILMHIDTLLHFPFRRTFLLSAAAVNFLVAFFIFWRMQAQTTL